MFVFVFQGHSKQSTGDKQGSDYCMFAVGNIIKMISVIKPGYMNGGPCHW